MITRPEDGRSLRPVCLLQICRVGSILYHWLDLPWLKRYYDFGFDHFGMSRRRVGARGLADLLLSRAPGDPFATGDWIVPDLTIHGAARINARASTFPGTFYFSYASRRTSRVGGVTVPSGLLGIHPLLFMRVLQMCRWRFPDHVHPPYKGYRYPVPLFFFPSGSLFAGRYSTRFVRCLQHFVWCLLLVAGTKTGRTTTAPSTPSP